MRRGISVRVAYKGIINFRVERCVNGAAIGRKIGRRSRMRGYLARGIKIKGLRLTTESQGILGGAAGSPLEGNS